jgi:hypothetical protein
MDPRAERMAAHQTQEPQKEQDDGDRPQQAV